MLVEKIERPWTPGREGRGGDNLANISLPSSLEFVFSTLEYSCFGPRPAVFGRAHHCPAYALD